MNRYPFRYLAIYFALLWAVGCAPTDRGGFGPSAGTYGTLESALAHADECHTVILRNLKPDGAPVAQPQALTEDLTRLPHLRKLVVYGLAAPEIPAFLGQMPALETLLVVHSLRPEPVAVGADLSRLTRLRSLHLESCRLEAVPALPASLRSLALKHAGLAEGGDLSGLNALESLDLSGNPLRAWPKGLGHMPQLAALSVANAQLDSLPAALNTLPLLARLDLTGNPLTRLPEWMGHMPALQRLVLFNCPLVALPPTLAQAPQLTEIWLACPIPPDSLEHLRAAMPRVRWIVSEYRGHR